MTIDEFGRTIKQKYPQYNAVSDQEIGQKMLEKYPQYKNQITQPAPTEPKRGFFGTLGQAVVGAAKGAASTVSNIGSMGQQALAGITNRASNALGGPQISQTPTMNQAFEGTTKIKPTNTAQKVGFAGEQIGEYFLPQTGIAKGVRLAEGIATKLPKVIQGAAKLTSRAGLEVGSTAAMSKAQGLPDEEVKKNALIAGAVPVAGALFNKARGVLGAAARKIETSQIKPNKADLADGFDVNNIFKYNLGGSLQDTAEKTHSRITELAQRLKGTIASSQRKLQLGDILDDVQKELADGKSTTFGQNTKLQKAIDFLREEIAVVAKDGKVDLSDAQQIKRSVGKLGAWQFGARDPDSTALETVANRMYSKLRVAIENAAPKEVAGINKELSELIPIENALIRRIPVAERNNILSLTDVITAVGSIQNPANLWVMGLNKLSKSTRLANVLSKADKPAANRGTLRTAVFGSGKEQPYKPLKIPKVNVGLSVEMRGADKLKFQELSDHASKLEKAKLNAPNEAARKRLQKAIQAANKEAKKLFR